MYLALTRNPRVDFISRRVEDIKAKKARVSSLARSAEFQLKTVRKTLEELDSAMLESFNDELGERKWDDDKATYTRELNPEERRLVSDMERVFKRCRETMDKVVGAYCTHLEETVEKPLTFNTPEEESRLARVMETKEEYKLVRTTYSDAMIDVDAELSTGTAPNSQTQQRLDEAKKSYDQMSDRLCEDALKYERIYRDELAQRVSSHFLAQSHLLRGVSTAMKDFLPYSQGLTLNWQDMRATRRANLTQAKQRERRGDDDNDSLNDQFSHLPTPSSSPNNDSGANRDSDLGGGSSSTLGNLSEELQRKGSNAATAISNAGKSASKTISGVVSSYGTKAATKSATHSVKSTFS